MHAYALPYTVNAPFSVCLKCYCEHSAPKGTDGETLSRSPTATPKINLIMLMILTLWASVPSLSWFPVDSQDVPLFKEHTQRFTRQWILPARSSQRGVIKTNPMLSRTTEIYQEVMNEVPHHGFPRLFRRHLEGLTNYQFQSPSYRIKTGQCHQMTTKKLFQNKYLRSV